MESQLIRRFSSIFYLKYVVAYRAGQVVAAERRIGFTHSHNDEGALSFRHWTLSEDRPELTSLPLSLRSTKVNWDTFDEQDRS